MPAGGPDPRVAGRLPVVALLTLLVACGDVSDPGLTPGTRPVGFAGAARCRDCHERRHATWTHDWHAKALVRATPGTVAGNFPAHFRGRSSEAWMGRDGDGWMMRTIGADGTGSDLPIQWLLGGKRMQDPLTVLPDGRWQVLPIYWHVTGKAWVDFTDTSQGTLDPGHPFFWANWRRNAQHECLDCHVTGLDVRYDRPTRTWRTSMVDAGVACESCHGPGARHADTRDAGDIVHPGRVSPLAGLAICGQCHGPRTPLFPILDAANRFQPGQAYDDHYQALVIVAGSERSHDFYADGRPRTSSHELIALLQSRCHLVGQATCLTCHTAPHEPSGPNELRDADPDASCRGCHEDVATAGRAHTRHEAPGAQQCIACHMPPVVSGVLDQFADHAIDVPVPENTVRHGVPNACNVCHTEASPASMATALHARWPQAASRQARRRRLADAIDEATATSSREALQLVVADPAEASTLRGAAVQLLAQRFPHASPESLRPLLRDPSVLVRAQTVEALGMAAARSTAADMVALLGDPSLTVRHVTALVLASFGDARGYDALRTLASDPATSGLVQPHVLLGMEAMHRGDLATAESELAQATTLMPYHAGAQVLLADIHARAGHANAARERLEEALTFDPQNASATRRLDAMGR